MTSVARCVCVMFSACVVVCLAGYGLWLVQMVSSVHPAHTGQPQMLDTVSGTSSADSCARGSVGQGRAAGLCGVAVGRALCD